MNILNFCLFDWGGGGFKLTEAINKHTKHKARHLLIGRSFMGYEYDMFTQDPEEILKWVNWADVIHCREFVAPLYIEDPNTQWYWLYEKLKAVGLKFPPCEKMVINHAGSFFRNRPGKQHEIAKKLNAKELCTTVNLLEAWDGTDLNDGWRGPLEWLPNPVPVDDYLKMKSEHDGKPIVCQSPTRRKRKRTNEILEQIAGKENIEVLIIENVPWVECMRLKSKADIYVDTFHWPYGWSSLEAMAMKIPVISKLVNDPSGWPQYERLVMREVGYLPHYDCPLEKLSEGIDALLSDEKLYEEYAELGFRYVKEFHDYPVVAKKFISICEAL